LTREEGVEGDPGDEPRHRADHFGTDQLRPRIRRLAISGSIASAAGQVAQLLLTLAYNVVLARLLSPHDFGLVAMATTVVSFLQVFKEAGLPTATIQREKITEAEVSNLFWINVGLSSIVAGLMAGMSPPVSRLAS